MKKVLLLFIGTICYFSATSQTTKQSRTDSLVSYIKLNGIVTYGFQVSQIFPIKDNKVIYTDVINSDSINKNELYKRGKKWFVETYKSGKDVIQIDDKESGEIIGKGFFEATIGSTNHVEIFQTISFQFKEGRYKYEIRDFYIKHNIDGNYRDDLIETYSIPSKDYAISFFNQINDETKLLIESFKKYIRTKPKEEW